MTTHPTIGTVAMGDIEAKIDWNNPNDPVVKLFVGYGVEEYVEEYEFRGDDGGYSPNEAEKGLLTDAIYGVVGDLHEKLRALDAALSTRPAQEPVAWLRPGEYVPIQGCPFGAMWISDKDDPRAFPVYRDVPCDPAAPQPVLSQPEVKAEGWQPIDTAPTDGREVRGITFDAQTPTAIVTKFVDGKWLSESKGEKFVAPGWNRWWPTHWQPIDAAAPSHPTQSDVSCSRAREGGTGE